jgi:hypothetical protein
MIILLVATRQFKQVEFQKKLSEIPKDISIKIQQIQNTAQFETLFNNASKTLFKNFKHTLENDERKQSISLIL